jgi:hypothetical protein
MERWINKFETVFVSVAFAEFAEHDDSREMLGIRYVDPKTIWEDVFVSVTFAEAG